ncbi:MAG TPA: cysteine peptidase family C39 domain-containing protein [Vicinamibacteria bacterium]|nr:cysteine peptidase family C39 domain-containing protein [Vicinamibacteria bacterium]
MNRRWIVPEVVQSSALDCGPAALKSLFEGHGISMSYGRLREACQTDVDGTSIDTLEEVAGQLGLRAEQILVPAEHLLLEEANALPAVLVVRAPNNSTHFIVVWSRFAGLVQLMDPAVGRRWVSPSQLDRELYEHVMPVPAAAWSEWARSAEASACWRRRLLDLGVSTERAEALVSRAKETPGWLGLASLDAAARAVSSMVRSRGVRKGKGAARAVESLFDVARRPGLDPSQAIPTPYWSVRAGSSPNGSSPTEETVLVRGAVLVRVRGRMQPSDRKKVPPRISPELRAARQERPIQPGRELLKMLRADGVLKPTALIAALFAAASAVVLEAVLFRSLLELTPLLELSGQRMTALGAVVALMMLLALVELVIARGQLQLGRRMEARLRIAFQDKITKLGDRYFRSRLTSDMAERNHSLYRLRQVPVLGGRLVRSTFELLLTAVGIIWLDWELAPMALLAAALALGIPLIAQPILQERDLRVRSHLAGLGRFTLDALLGLVPLRVHGAERSLRREHEALLSQWARARLKLQGAAVTLEATQFFVGYALAVLLVFQHVGRGAEIGLLLLLAYWALNLPVLGLEVAQLARRYPEHRNVTLRTLEPLNAPEEQTVPGSAGPDGTQRTKPPGVSIRMQDVSVQLGGHRVLEGLELSIERGSHVALVGASGAGKTTFLGLLLGWHRAFRGTIFVDDEVLDGRKLLELRAQTAWVDPAVQLWNRSLLDNLRYGATLDGDLGLARVVEQANLRPVLEMLPQGHQTFLGEGGGLVSGGEGQRVRLARAMLRSGVRLAVLDEPFRGLDRPQRIELLSRARELWRSATLICATHDVGETRTFDRVLVMSGGRIVEDGGPGELLERPGSFYQEMLRSEEEARALWRRVPWRRVRLERGRAFESEAPP